MTSAWYMEGGEATQALLRQQHWSWYSSAREYRLNRSFAVKPGERWWRSLARTALEKLPGRVDVANRNRRLQDTHVGPVEVIEETHVTSDMIPQGSPFTFRFTPTVEHLNWRYDTALSFVQYRLFRIVSQFETRGYVVLNVQRNRILVAQCDCEDALTLVRGVMAALAVVSEEENRKAGVVWSAAHDDVQRMLTELGFRTRRVDRPFALGSLHKKPPPASSTKDWLINVDWGDNGLRPPFPGLKSL